MKLALAFHRHAAQRFLYSSSRALQYVQFAGNKFNGPLEDRFNDTGLNNLIALAINDNQFSGPIPESIEGLDSLAFLLIQNNNFSGPVPGNICNITGPNNLRLLEADCGGDPIANQCTCCTRCCDRVNKVCEYVGRRLSFAMDDFQEEDDMEINYPHPYFNHEHLIPKKRRKLQNTPQECSAVYRWNSDTGRLELYVEEQSQ